MKVLINSQVNTDKTYANSLLVPDLLNPLLFF